MGWPASRAAVRLASSPARARLGSNIEINGERVRIREYEKWPLRIEYWHPHAAEEVDPDAMLWKIEVRHRDAPVLEMLWSDERERLSKYETGAREDLLLEDWTRLHA